MDSDKDLIKRAVGNSAEMSMSTSAQKRTIDWVDPHSEASTPRKLQSPRGGVKSDIVQKEEAMRVEEEQEREAPKELAEPEIATEKKPETAEATEIKSEQKAEEKQPETAPTTDTTDQSQEKEPITKTNGHTQKEDVPTSATSADSADSKPTPSSEQPKSKDSQSSTPTRSEASPQPPATYNTWKYSIKTITKSSPSAKEGMPFREELTMRTKGINFLGNVAKLLQLPHMAVYTACTFFHRFYMRHSIKSKHPFEAAAVCIFLATKVEEANRHLRDVCICLVKVAQKDHRAVVDEQSKDFWRWRDCILYGEGFFLEVLCFDLTLDSPFEHLSYYVKKLGINHVREVCKTAWEFVTDSCKTPLCLMFSTNTIALAAIYWAAKHNKTPIDYQKETKAKGKLHWVECFDMTRNEVVFVVETFCDWYGVLQRDFGLATSYPKLK